MLGFRNMQEKLENEDPFSYISPNRVPKQFKNVVKFMFSERAKNLN